MPRRGWNWRLDRVYFLAFLNPSGGQPDPALTARLASPDSVGRPAAGTRLIYRPCRKGVGPECRVQARLWGERTELAASAPRLWATRRLRPKMTVERDLARGD